MKYVSRIALLLLMAGLMALALVLPKFVQPKQSDSSNKRQPDYVLPENEPEMLPEYTPKSSDSGNSFLSSTQSTVTSEEYLAQIKSQKAAPNYDKLLEPFLVKLQNGDLDGAEKVLNESGSKLSSSIKAGLQFSLDSARESQEAIAVAKAETAKAIHATKEAAILDKVNEEKKLALASSGIDTSNTTSGANNVGLQSESVEKIKASLIELGKATEAAKLAAREAEKSARETAKLRARY